MAESTNPKRRPRIRKSAPTVRELAEAARSKEEEVKPRRITGFLAKSSTPIKKAAARKQVRIIVKPFSWIRRVLAWLVPKYLINSWRELRQVHWPNRRETWRLTVAVFIFAIVFGAMVAGVDKVLDELFKKVVLK